MSNPATPPRAVSDQVRGNRGAGPAPAQLATPSALELVSEVSDLAAGVGLLIFTLTPLALPALAPTALVAIVLLIPALVGAMLAAPFLLAWRWRRARDRLPAATTPARFGDGERGYASATRL